MKYFSLWHFIKTSTGSKPLRIKLDKIDGFVRVRCSEYRYLVSFGHGLFDKISEKIKYLISEVSGITDSINQNFGEIRIDSYNSLPVKKYWFFIMW